MSDTTFQLDPTLLNEVNSIDLGGNANSLPFAVRHPYVINGDARMANMAQSVPAMYYGGFAVDKNDWDNFLTTQNLRNLPGMAVGQIAGRDNKMVDIYTTRSLYIAPVASRTAWIVEDGNQKKRVPDYVPGARRHTQMLVVLGSKSDDGQSIVVYSPAVLTAKGYQAQNLLKSLDDWTKHTASIRAQEAPGVPAWLFWLAIGTFGADRKQTMVGKGAKSAITPIGAYLPEPMTVEIMKKTYGGEALAKAIVTYRTQAQDWVKAWEAPQEPKSQSYADYFGKQNSGGQQFPTAPVAPVDPVF